MSSDGGVVRHVLPTSTTSASIKPTWWLIFRQTEVHKSMDDVILATGSSLYPKNALPMHQLDVQQCLNHGEGNPVRCHWAGLNRDPQVFVLAGSFLFLLGFWPCCCRCISAATAATSMATTAAVTAHQQGGKEDQQGKSQQDHQADSVVDSLVVFFCHNAPKLVEKILNAV